MTAQSGIVIRQVDLTHDAEWIIDEHEVTYAKQFGWHGVGGFVGAALADYERAEPSTWGGWVAEVDSRRMGCVFVEQRDHSAEAVLRLLFVDAAARGLRIGGRLVDAVVDHARTGGGRRVRLWTTDVQEAARSIYARAGFVQEASAPHVQFGVEMQGETWALDLSAPD